MYKNEYLKLCLVTHIKSRSIDDYQKIILSAIRGGVTSIQLREKNLSFKDLKSLALSLQTLLKPYKIPFIINDNVALAKEIDADGVHLGQTDISPIDARKLLGKDKIIGLSIESFQELEIANQLDCINYIAASAVFQSKTKNNCRTIWGLDGLKEIVKKSIHPVIAIGGINSKNINDVMECGAAGVAVISAIHDHPQPEVMADIMLHKIKGAKYV